MIRTRPCYHNIDKPILVLGLEYQDWALVLVFFLVFIVLPVCSNLSVVVLTIVCGGLLRLVKRGKPPGYVWHRLYRWGMPLPSLLPPRVQFYSAFPRQSAGLMWRKRHAQAAGSLEES